MDVDGATVPFYDFLAHGQSDAGTGVFCAGVQPLKEHKNAFNVLRLDANPVVAYAERPVIVGRTRRHLHDRRETWFLELDCVCDEILEELVELTWVCAQSGQISASNTGCGILDCRAKVRNHLVDYLIKIG